MSDFKTNATIHYTSGKKSEEQRCEVLRGQYDTTILLKVGDGWQKFHGNWDSSIGCLKLKDYNGEFLYLVTDPTMPPNWIGRWEDTDDWGMVYVEMDNAQI